MQRPACFHAGSCGWQLYGSNPYSVGPKARQGAAQANRGAQGLRPYRGLPRDLGEPLYCTPHAALPSVQVVYCRFLCLFAFCFVLFNFLKARDKPAPNIPGGDPPRRCVRAAAGWKPPKSPRPLCSRAGIPPGRLVQLVAAFCCRSFDLCGSFWVFFAPKTPIRAQQRF